MLFANVVIRPFSRDPNRRRASSRDRDETRVVHGTWGGAGGCRLLRAMRSAARPLGRQRPQKRTKRGGDWPMGVNPQATADAAAEAVVIGRFGSRAKRVVSAAKRWQARTLEPPARRRAKAMDKLGKAISASDPIVPMTMRLQRRLRRADAGFEAENDCGEPRVAWRRKARLEEPAGWAVWPGIRRRRAWRLSRSAQPKGAALENSALPQARRLEPRAGCEGSRCLRATGVRTCVSRG